jgi:hypothetical protein
MAGLFPWRADCRNLFSPCEFLALDKRTAAQKTVWWGVLISILIFAIPDVFIPKYVLPVTYCSIAFAVANRAQLKKADIASSEKFRFQSNWNVAGMAAMYLLLTLLFGFAIIFSLVYFDVIDVS